MGGSSSMQYPSALTGSNLTGGHNRLSCPRSADTALRPHLTLPSALAKWTAVAVPQFGVPWCMDFALWTFQKPTLGAPSENCGLCIWDGNSL